MMNKLLVFDIDGTLTDTVKIHISSFIKVLNQMGVERQEFNFKTYKHHTDSYVAKTIYEEELKTTFSELEFDEFKNLITDKIKEHPIIEISGAKVLMKWLSQQSSIGYCFATGSIRKAAEYKLNQLGIDFQPEQLVTSDHYISREEIVGNAINQAKTFYNVSAFDEIISIGDGLWDLKTAQNLDLQFIGVGKENEQIMRENGMTTFVTDLKEIMNLSS